MTRQTTVLAIATLWACACASGKSGTGIPDAEVVETADAAVIDATPKGGFWEICIEHSDCESGVCYYADEADESGHCTDECEGTCPDGYACQVVQIADFTDIRVCIPAVESFCVACETNVDCGDSGDFCIEFTGHKACSIDCSTDAEVCPVGFTCQTVAGTGDTVVGEQCMPANGICCVDGDSDLRGEGSGCLGSDCDDDNDAVYDDADEVCDGFDNDCVGGVDVDFTDCAAAECKLGGLGYYQRAAETCLSAACDAQSEELCGLYTCADGGEVGDACATACDSEDSGKCVPAAHCDLSVCYDDVIDGGGCDEGSDCISDHCKGSGGDYCCPFGDCCQVASDCPTYGTQDPVCENPATCQGSRGEAVCNVNFTCGTTGTEADDSACDAATVANNCGYYKPIFCNGDVAQSAPTCPTSCLAHSDCDVDGFCDVTSHTCVEDRDNGIACGTDDVTCKSGHCQNGFCCNSPGDCCADKSDCPASYTGVPDCTVPTACQGEQDIGECVDFTCATTTGNDNDTACDGGTLASNCGLYPDYYCTGGFDQSAPSCADACVTDLGCDANAYCNLSGYCVPDGVPGQQCNEGDGLGDAECVSGHCQNGFCCIGTGDCCNTNTDCLAYAVAADCYDVGNCQGQHTDGVCNVAKQCGAVLVEDDSICSGEEASNCGLYLSVFCSSAAVQSAPACASSCGDDGDCDASAHCDSLSCVSDAQQGDSCVVTEDCAGSLVCVDYVCCASGCGGICEACDLSPGGECELVGDGLDPDDECDAVSCASYYYGWVGDTCYRRADLDDAAMTCTSGNSCYSAATDCPSSAQGSGQISCSGACQTPNLGTCSGTTAGACNSGTPSTQESNLLSNANFDSGPGYPPWYEYSYLDYDLIMSTGLLPSSILPIPSGSYAVWLGGDDYSDDYIYQDVAIPADATALALRGYLWIFTEETTTVSTWDDLYIELRNPATNALLETLALRSNLDAAEAWVYFSWPAASAYAGQSVRLYIHSTTDVSNISNFHFDSLELDVTQPICL